MKSNQNTSWEDLLFKNRNKAYGAYDLRKTEGFTLLKSLFTGLFVIGSLVLILSFTVKNEPVIEIPKDPTIVILTEISPEIEKPLTNAPPKVIVKKVDVPIEDERTPEPKNDPIIEKPVKDNHEIGTIVMLEKGIGENTGSISSNTTTSSVGTSTAGATQPEKPNTNTEYMARDVAYMAVYPGCENVGNDKLSLQNCMSKNLQKELVNQLNNFSEFMVTNNLQEANAKLLFVIDKQGRIVQVEALKGGNKELSSESKKALERIAQRLAQKGKYIQPAKLDDGTEVNIKLSIPIKFKVD